MIIVKLIVLFVYTDIFLICRANYCGICRNHTLCLYTIPGPSVTCRAYDATVLTMNEINEIVNKINERRNFIAMGLSKFLPQAANMKRIVWSQELATFAQRWVDQCHQSTRPDKEDSCRDTDDTRVGQNIATIIGPSPGLSVKSFVEMWFIQSLEYKGSVAYYNQTRDHNTNYFTQLIWAATGSVGCGKARFYVTDRNTMVERLVCNFAPGGNIYGKPVYTIGYPSTQCENSMADMTYPGLCYNQKGNVKRFTTHRAPVRSLLRILNLSNHSAKQEIDPIGSNLKQVYYNSNKTKDQRNQKIRHIYFNNTYGGMKRASSLQVHHFSNSPINISDVNHYQQERGHSRVYHGYESQRNNHDTIHKENNGKDLRRYDYTTEPMNSYPDNDFRKHNHNQQCTRKAASVKTDYLPSECITDACTRGQKSNNCGQPVSSCVSPSFPLHFNNACPCNKQTSTCTPIATGCSCNANCQFLNTDCATPRCSGILRIKEDQKQDEKRKSADSHYYDMPPYIAVRSGDEISPLLISSLNTSFHKTKNYDQNRRQVKNIMNEFGYPKLTFQDRDYSYGSFDSSERKRRELGEQITFKPFWQMDEYNFKKPSELKAIRYTTLGNKRDKKTRRTTVSGKPTIVTESITFKFKETNHNHRGHITEKYLSFDELMHLRKFSTEDADKDARRKADDINVLRQQTTTTATTTEYTANTPFIRKKHCTRKLTCTWTAFTMTGSDGILQGGLDRGSRTPPGYVEGCTRTSTCTRDFMNRNRMPVTPGENSTVPTPEDEDYCERRSLNLQRRNTEEKSTTDLDTSYQESFTDKPTSTSRIPFLSSNDDSSSEASQKQDSCLCYDQTSRRKRDENNKNTQLLSKIKGNYNAKSASKKYLSYGELYYLVLHKILKSWESNRISHHSSECLCSSTFAVQISKYLNNFMIIFILIL